MLPVSEEIGRHRANAVASASRVSRFSSQSAIVTSPIVPRQIHGHSRSDHSATQNKDSSGSTCWISLCSLCPLWFINDTLQ